MTKRYSENSSILYGCPRWRLLFGFPVPIIVVVLMNEMRLFRVKKFVQTLIYLPHFVSWVIIAGILQSFTQTGGTFQNFLAAIFGKEIHFFSDATCFGVLIISDIWKEAGWNTIIYLAAIAGIDPCLEEAASIDGAGKISENYPHHPAGNLARAQHQSDFCLQRAHLRRIRSGVQYV